MNNRIADIKEIKTRWFVRLINSESVENIEETSDAANKLSELAAEMNVSVENFKV